MVNIQSCAKVPADVVQDLVKGLQAQKFMPAVDFNNPDARHCAQQCTAQRGIHALAGEAILRRSQSRAVARYALAMSLSRASSSKPCGAP